MEPAAAPNPPSVVNSIVYAADGVRRDVPLEGIGELLARDAGSFAWIGLYEPDDAVLERLQEDFDLHDLAIEDAHKAHQRPKLEAYGNAFFLVASTAQVVAQKIAYGETHVFFGPRYLITVRHGASLSYAAARAHIEREPELLALGPAFGLYAVLDAIVDNYVPIVDEFKATLPALEKDIVSESFDRDTVIRLYDLKRELTYMQVNVAPMQDVLSQLVRSANPLLPEEVRVYLRDVLDHSLRINQTIDVLRDMLGTALTVNQALVTQAQGEVVKRLGAWAALLAVPTLVTSWYGMNFRAMPELGGRYAYPALLVGVAAICVGLYRRFRRIGWL